MINGGKYTSPMDGMGVVLNITIEPMPSLSTFHQSRAGYWGRWCPRKNGVSIPVPVLVVFSREGHPMSPRIRQQSFRWVKDCIARWWFQIFYIFQVGWNHQLDWYDIPYCSNSPQRWRIGASGCFWWDVLPQLPHWVFQWPSVTRGDTSEDTVANRAIFTWSPISCGTEGLMRFRRDLQMFKDEEPELLARSFRHMIALYVLVFSNISPLNSLMIYT